jgi:hypothetical protein
MSISVFEPVRTKASASPLNVSRHAAPSLHESTNPTHGLAPFVDLEQNPYAAHTNSRESNPVAELIPDEVYILLRSNDMINEKAVRDYVIRRAFRELRQQQHVKTTEAIEKIKEIYPYLQLDTIRKIIYRINPVSGRKMMI